MGRIAAQHPAELALGRLDRPLGDVQVRGEQVAGDAVGVERQTGGHQGGRLGVASFAAQAIGVREEVAWASPAPARTQQPLEHCGHRRLTRGSREELPGWW